MWLPAATIVRRTLRESCARGVSRHFSKTVNKLQATIKRGDQTRNFSIPKVIHRMRPHVFLTRSNFPSTGIDLLQHECDIDSWSEASTIPRDKLLQSVVGKDAIFCSLTDKIDAEVIRQAGSTLKVIGTMSVGYEHIDLEECKIRGIRVGYTPDVLTDAVADLTIGLLLATSRRLIEGNHDVHNGGWRSWQPLYMCGPGLRNSTIGLVGFGRIAQEVAKRLLPFKPKRLIYSNRSASRENEAKEIGVERVPFEQMLASSDFVILLCALTPETRHLMNARTFGLMKRTAILINCARGAVVEQDDLFEALRTNVIRAAGLDVTTPEPLPLDSPLLGLRNCVILPHIGSAETETRLEMSRITALNILGALKNTEMVYEL